MTTKNHWLKASTPPFSVLPSSFTVTCECAPLVTPAAGFGVKVKVAVPVWLSKATAGFRIRPGLSVDTETAPVLALRCRRP